MSDTKDGGSAFPIPAHKVRFGDDRQKLFVSAAYGMSLRDYFAAQVMAVGWKMEVERPTGPYTQNMEPTYLGAAQRAYFFADAMLKAREEQS